MFYIDIDESGLHGSYVQSTLFSGPFGLRMIKFTAVTHSHALPNTPLPCIAAGPNLTLVQPLLTVGFTSKGMMPPKAINLGAIDQMAGKMFLRTHL